MKNLKTHLVIIIAIFIFSAHFSLAQNALGVPCDPAEPDTWETATGCLNDSSSSTNAQPNPNATGTPATGTAKSDASAPGGLVKCGKAGGQTCQFSDLLNLVNNVVRFILFAMALPIAAIMFAYAGFLLVTSGGSSEAKGKAKRIFTATAVGFIIAVAAWLIIHTLLSIVGFSGSWIGL